MAVSVTPFVQAVFNEPVRLPSGEVTVLVVVLDSGPRTVCVDVADVLFASFPCTKPDHVAAPFAFGTVAGVDESQHSAAHLREGVSHRSTLVKSDIPLG